MGSALLAITAALSWGTSDFVGGRVSRSLPSMLVVWAAGVLTVVLTGTIGLVMGIPARLAGALVFGAVAGLAVAGGAIALYHGLAIGRSAVVAPTAGVVGAVIPVAVDLGRGVTLRPTAIAGMVIGVGAIWLLAGGRALGAGAGGFSFGVMAGLGFGAMFALLGLAPDDTGIWPVFGSKVASVVLTTLLLRGRKLLSPGRLGTHLTGVMAIGLADTLATTAYLFAARLGEVSVAAVIASFYPAPTVALSAIFHGESLAIEHWIGGALAIAAIALVSV